MKEFKFNIGDKVKTINGEIGIISKQLLTVTEDEEVEIQRVVLFVVLRKKIYKNYTIIL